MTALHKIIGEKELVIVRGKGFFNLAINKRSLCNFFIVTRKGKSNIVPNLIDSSRVGYCPLPKHRRPRVSCLVSNIFEKTWLGS
jgi:hypothetical protein